MNVFEEVNEIIVSNEHNGIDTIKIDNHQCVIFQHIPYNNNQIFDDVLELDKNVKYELDVIMSVNYIRNNI